MLSHSPAHAADNSLADYRSVFEKELAKIDTARDASRREAAAAYEKHLELAREELKKKGSLEGVLLVTREMERFTSEHTVPQELPEECPPSLALVRQKYHSSQLAAEQTRNGKATKLARLYLVRLKALIKQLVQQDHLDRAEEVAAEIKRVEFILADLEPVAQKVEQTETQEVAQTDDEEYFVERDELPASLRKGLILHYTFDDEAATKATDESERQNSGTVHNAEWTRLGRVGGAYVFDGERSYIQADKPIDPDDLQALTVCAWFRVTGVAEYNPIFCWDHDDRWGTVRAQITPPTALEYRFGSGSRRTAYGNVATVDKHAWHHVAVVHKTGKRAALYLDGKKHHQSDHELPLKNNDSTFRVGAGYAAKRMNYFQGLIDEVMIFDRALSYSEVKRVYSLAK